MGTSRGGLRNFGYDLYRIPSLPRIGTSHGGLRNFSYVLNRIHKTFYCHFSFDFIITFATNPRIPGYFQVRRPNQMETLVI